MTNDVDRRAGFGGDRIRDCGHVLVLPLDRVGGPVAGRPAAAPIDRMEAKARFEKRSGGPPGRVIGGRSVDEDDRRPVTGGEDRDRCAVPRDDRALLGRHGRQR